MDLVDREDFLKELGTAFSEVTAGKGQFVLVSGEAGIGKTSLVERFAETQKQARLLWGAGALWGLLANTSMNTSVIQNLRPI
jgi:AAA ATPase domain